MSLKKDLANEMKIASLVGLNTSLGRKYKLLQKELQRVERERNAVVDFKEITTHTIVPVKNLSSEAVAVVLASDWHIEEQVKSSTVSGLNRYNLKIAEERIRKFFFTLIKMVGMYQRDIPIHTLILWLGGDFFSNDIHEEVAELAETSPINAIIMAQNILASGIERILADTNLNLVIPCSSGNHARTTKKVRFSTEDGHSLEYFMYHNLQRHFKGNKRVKFILSGSYHTYVDALGYRLRFHHGHAVKYGGGIGGIFIPMFKALGQWDKAVKADYSFCGHFHQMKDGGNFVSNGSLIGYNGYALSIKADYEKPKQAFVLIDKARGKTVVSPIVLD